MPEKLPSRTSVEEKKRILAEKYGMILGNRADMTNRFYCAAMNQSKI